MAVGANPPAGGASIGRGASRSCISIGPDRPRAGFNAIAGKVGAEGVFWRPRSHYFITVAGIDKPIAVAHQNVERSLDDSDAIGRGVWLTWPANAAALLTS